MKILELYIGNQWGEGIFKEYGYDGMSCKIELFDYSIYPRDNFDIIFININSTNGGFSEDIDFGYLEFGLDMIEYYNPKFWLINEMILMKGLRMISLYGDYHIKI